MAAPTCTNVKVFEDAYRARFVHTGLSGGTDESGVTKIDVSELAGTNPLADEQLVVVESIKWWINGTGTLEVIQEAADVAILTGIGELSGELAAAGGDITFTSTGLTTAGESYTVEITIRKEAGFSSVPVPTDADLDAAAYVTGDKITATVTFDRPVKANLSNCFLELVIDETTRRMNCITEEESDEIEFEYTVVAADAAEATDVAFGDLISRSADGLAGGSPWGGAILEGFASDLSAVTINAAATVESVALTGDDSTPYSTGDVFEITVTMDKPVTVTGTPRVPITITSGNKNASYAGYGADHTKLLFRYTIVGGDVALATGVDITGDISLNSGTIKNEDAPGVAAILTLAASDTSGVAIN